jgi:hypothetical protein
MAGRVNPVAVAVAVAVAVYSVEVEGERLKDERCSDNLLLWTIDYGLWTTPTDEPMN